VAGIVDLIDLHLGHFGEKPAAHVMRVESGFQFRKSDHARMLEQFRIGWTQRPFQHSCAAALADRIDQLPSVRSPHGKDRRLKFD
jgi:hypothetical protein